jgi:hypothetical protein
VYCGPFAAIVIENVKISKERNKLMNSLSHGEHEGLPPASLSLFA